jgi:hypothetical protein
MRPKAVSEYIAQRIRELDTKLAAHQRNHFWYHGCEDELAKHLHKMLVNELVALRDLLDK